MGRLRTTNGRPLAAYPHYADAAIANSGDPVVLNADGEVAICAANATSLSGWTLDTASAAADTVHVVPATDDIRWTLPLTGTIGGGDLTTVAGQTTAGASTSSVGATLRALLGGFYSLEGSTGAWKVGLDDVANDCLQLVGYHYNVATRLWEGECIVIPTARVAHDIEV